ncbi:MAG: GNAT family N-acetyltransferase [Gaiellaceae bacterium]
MPDVEIRPFSDEDLDDAAQLLAARHRRHRSAEPLLPERFEDPAAAREQVEALWRQDAAAGACCLRGGRLVGYVIGVPRDPDVWGENVWVDYAGQAVEEAEDARDLYAAAAAEWVAQGRKHHFVQVPASEAALVDSWFRVGFGQQQADGLREVSAHTAVGLPSGLEIRTPTAEDVEALLPVDLALPRQHRSAPVFGVRPLPTEEQLRAEWAKTLSSDEETLLVGYQDGKPVACWALVDSEHAPQFHGLHAPDRACYLKFAATLPDARGRGIGVALTEASFAWAAEEGYDAIGTDWRVTNLLASRFWPRRGFRTTFLRLHRQIQ